jgi:glycosyltransferase involved in cell wall biosynthesis
MSAGCPVVTSNVSSLPEVAGETALLVNPHKTEEIASALKKIIDNPKLAHQLREAGKKQAEKFTWEKTAQETLKVYKELL